MPLSTDRFLAEVEASAAKLAGIISDCDPALPVPTCPDWTLRQLATHVGRVHRWAAEIVSTAAAEGLPFKAAPDGVAPADPAGQAGWLTAGAQRVTRAIRLAGTEPVWAFGKLAPATFWARRQAHETMVHRADAELAAGRDVELDPVLAADGIDEWLTIMAGPRYGRSDARSAALPPGAVLHVHATGPDSEGTGSGEWLISHSAEDDIVVRAEHGEADVTVCGPAGPLLLMLVRRLPPDDAALTVSGDAALLAGWLAGTPF
jgi:uncharacterized protein (TIGR03083 family)